MPLPARTLSSSGLSLRRKKEMTDSSRMSSSMHWRTAYPLHFCRAEFHTKQTMLRDQRQNSLQERRSKSQGPHWQEHVPPPLPNVLRTRSTLVFQIERPCSCFSSIYKRLSVNSVSSVANAVPFFAPSFLRVQAVSVGSAMCCKSKSWNSGSSGRGTCTVLRASFSA